MADFPFFPRPSSVSAPTIIDPLHRFESDSGVEIRRAKHSRPRRRYEVTWLGLTTVLMHDLRDFVLEQRMGLTPFAWYHPTAVDYVVFNGDTPVWLGYHHGLITGQWVWITNATPNTTMNNIWQVTRANPNNVICNNSLGNGSDGTATVSVYLPYAVARFPDDTWQAPDKLIGPEQTNWTTQTSNGFFNVSLLIEEIF